MTKVFGIDISVWQKDMNLETAKNEGVKFAIIRGMYGNAKDVAFESNYTKAKNAGLDVGVYQWSRAANVAQAREEAQLLIEHCLKGKKFEYPIYIDVEDRILINLSVQELTDLITAWCETLENAGYFTGVYMNQSCFNNEIKGQEIAEKYSQWRAYWTTENKKPNCQMWQFGGETNCVRTNKVAGVVCDQDYAYEDFPSVIKNAGLNGYSKDSSSSNSHQINTDTTSEETVYTVVSGDTLSGIASRYGTTYQRLAEYNGISNPNLIYPGQQIRIPGSSQSSNPIYYTVVTGDNLTKIANRYGTTVNRLVAWNNISNPNLIYPGQKLRVK
ncbi:MAG TPA: LysM peptidoglycan-binding domain-containing protein [Candidatus Onthousia faecipullorum]|uniref:LysM peptidoglycan-binding domain-containing protein n=1 Tax=Candidatus Onthousia faecipullorum TaxID=2840887 RepID=A0A9D1GAV7_9FIRM|nr:LysM peptidoglycan-binding domain-containing protein [Candidatus Onthousia faecipullorum]